MNDQDLIQARTAVENILKKLDVARVVYVDDWNATSPTVEDTIAAALTIGTAVLQPLFPELGESLPDDPDILRNKIRDVWKGLEANVKSERGKTIIVAARRHAGDETDDAADIAILEQIIPQDRLISLSPSEWGSQQERLLKESKTARTIFIFDRDLSYAGGDSESGIKIIASLLAKGDASGRICGLLTHTVTPETQPQQWEDLSNAHGIDRDRFVVIPKSHLSKAPILFAQILKIAALSPDFKELKNKTKKIIADAAAAAADRVEKVTTYDLDHIVFQVSTEEGLWEPDMLFRLHAMFHRLESRRLAHDGVLESIAAKLRALSGIPTKSDLLPPPKSAWGLQREELYENDDYINKNHLPLELGDIFERVGGEGTKKYFILLAQPCDLMVRSSGRREPELKRLPLAEVVSVPAGQKTLNYSEEMPYFDESSVKKWFVKLKSVHFVSGCILDLCVFNQDGVAKLTVDGNAPSGIRPAWKARYDILSHDWGRAVRKADIFAPAANESREVTQAKKNIARNFRDLLFDDDLFKGGLTEYRGVRSVTYNCKRVGRLSRARAIGLLMSYTATIGRPAYDRDFGTV